MATYWDEGNHGRAMWNQYNTVRPRKTNVIERWHGKLQQMICRSHPNLFEVTDVLKKEQAYQEKLTIQLKDINLDRGNTGEETIVCIISKGNSVMVNQEFWTTWVLCHKGIGH